MAEVDTSIYSKFAPPPPLETMGKLQALQKSRLDNELLGMNLSQTQAQREAARQSIDPATGQQDIDSYIAKLAAGGASPESMVGAQTQKNAKLQQFQSEIDLEIKKLGLTKEGAKMLGQSITPFIQKFSTPIPAGSPGPDGKVPMQTPAPTQDEFRLAILQAVQSLGSSATPQLVRRAFDGYESAKDDPAKMLEIAKAMALYGDPSQENIDKLFGELGTRDTGSTIESIRTPTITGIPEVMATTPKTLPPSELANLVKQIDNDPKSPTFQQEILVPRGAMGGLPGAQGTTGGGSASSGTGRYPGGQTAPAGVPGAVGVASLPLGAEASAQKSAETFQSDVAEAGGYAQRLQGLTKAEEGLQKAFTGPGADTWQKFGGVLNTFGFKPPTDVNSYAEAQKYLQDYANTRGAALGMGTDQARAMVNAANPGVQTPKGAALAVVNVFKGLERMQAAQVAAAQAEGVQPGQYAQWRAKWNRSVDPAAFAAPRLDKSGWEAKRKELGDKWPKYKKGLDAALAAGVLSPSDLRK